ncbi:MAG: glycerophosphodiester phosphodiesterase family protein [Dinoroseobacter sp.]|nr:glycerophosphodiester phosphodiesterase family protein [Dinoroseobacter sp.]
MLKETIIRYREATAIWTPLFVVHIFIRLLISALLVPVIATILTVSLSMSGQSALTDQDIAWFLLSPAGAVAGLAVVSLLIVAAVLDLAVMTALLHHGLSRPGKALQAAARVSLNALVPLTRFALALLIRVLLLAAPFLVAAGLIAAMLLREFDINYYLTARPPSFTAAIVIIGALVAVLGGLLIHRLSGWAIALHLTLFEGSSARASFIESRERMEGHRKRLIFQLMVWLGIRIALASVLGIVAGFLLGNTPNLWGENLRLLTGSIILISVLWSIANSALSALANGVLADILNDEFERSQLGRTTYEDHSASAAPDHLLSRSNLTIAAVGLLSLTSLGAGGVLMQRVTSDTEIEVIGHRGAAALKPENTMAAVLKAVEDGADWVEIDVQESAEGEVIVAHDSDFMKAARVPTKVWDVTAAELETIDIGSWFDPAYADERTPTLRQVLDAVKDRSNLLIELKYYGHDVDLENRVIALVEAAGMADQAATMSLKYPAVQKMISLRPDWRAGVLAATSVGDLSGLDGDFLAVNTAQASTRLIQSAHAVGKDVYVWTVNEPASMMRMISLGVDGLITDDPALVREVISFYSDMTTIERALIALSGGIGVAFDLDPPEDLRP